MARERKQTVEFYYSMLRDLYDQTDAIPTRLKDIKQIKAKLSSLKRKKLEGLEMKTKVKSVTEDETAALYHLVRHAKNRSFVDELQIDGGTILTTQKEIITEISARLSAKERGRRLVQAAEWGAVGQLRALIAAGADVAARDVRGLTALHCAARWGAYGRAEVAAALLDAGADRRVTTGDGETALDLARRFNQSRLVEMLS
ncbi:uncharacterized protein LOC126159854 [Schistocerca cancellata]|uniref:uncharacterized protein LOC126159854 n=1 Tax=Schistocerca cancellata TaxID=274614 RepID=UPI0021174852|nr:uncharacterized protein LOC126159854 [Schistocerca cancellata]